MTGSADLDALTARLEALEAREGARSAIMRYMELCDDLHPEADLAALGELFTEDAVWRGGVGKYRSTFGEHRGRNAIVAFLTDYADPPHFQSNAHFLNSEQMSAGPDGVSGQWMMLQCPTFSNGESWLMAAKIEAGFRFEDGRWRIATFQTTNIFSRAIGDGWNSDAPVPKPAAHKQS